MQVRILCRALLASKFFLATYFLDLSLSGQSLNFFGLIFIPNFFLNFLKYVYILLIKKFEYIFLNQFAQQSIINFYVFIEMF